MVEQWNSDGGTVWYNTGTVIVEQCGERVWWNSDGGTVWWNRGTVFFNNVVEQWNSDGGTVLVEQFGGTLEQCGGTVMEEQCWWNSVVEQ